MLFILLTMITTNRYFFKTFIADILHHDSINQLSDHMLETPSDADNSKRAQKLILEVLIKSILKGFMAPESDVVQ